MAYAFWISTCKMVNQLLKKHFIHLSKLNTFLHLIYRTYPNVGKHECISFFVRFSLPLSLSLFRVSICLKNEIKEIYLNDIEKE